MVKSRVIAGIKAYLAAMAMEGDEIRCVVGNTALPELLDYAFSALHSVTLCVGLNDPDGNYLDFVFSIYRQHGCIIKVMYEFSGSRQAGQGAFSSRAACALHTDDRPELEEFKNSREPRKADGDWLGDTWGRDRAAAVWGYCGGALFRGRKPRIMSKRTSSICAGNSEESTRVNGTIRVVEANCPIKQSA